MRTESACSKSILPCLRFQPKQMRTVGLDVRLLDVIVSSISRPVICHARFGDSVSVASVTAGTLPSQGPGAWASCANAPRCKAMRMKTIDAAHLPKRNALVPKRSIVAPQKDAACRGGYGRNSTQATHD